MDSVGCICVFLNTHIYHNQRRNVIPPESEGMEEEVERKVTTSILICILLTVAFALVVSVCN